MAQKRAGSLALVTCKEPINGNLGSHIRQFLSEFDFTDVRVLRSPAFLLACKLIRCAASGPRPGHILAGYREHRACLLGLRKGGYGPCSD